MSSTGARVWPLSCFMAVALLLLAPGGAAAQTTRKLTAEDFRSREPAFFATEEGKRVVDSVIAHQLPNGGWRKQYDIHKPPDDRIDPEWTGGTIDNGATYSELRILASAHKGTGRADVAESFNRGLDFLFTTQYPEGGFPQRYPLREDYSRFVTFNDNAMARVLELMLDVAENAGGMFSFVNEQRRAGARDSFDRGVDCIVRLQFKRDGKLTAWGQQHDPKTGQPAKARVYELPSLACDETVGILRVLMRVENPSPQVKAAVHSGVAWVQASTLHGIRTERKPDASLPKGYDVYVVEDSAAPPIWARFYELDTNRPFFCGRDGVKKYKLDEIEPERRSGYAWLRPYGAKIGDEYGKWLKKHGETAAPGTGVDGTTPPSDAATRPTTRASASDIVIPPKSGKTRIVLAGDSTVTDNAGWGLGLKELLSPDVELLNFSRGGRSSKSFRDEGRWAKCLEARPDYIFIQFGHNDEPGKGMERETDAATTYYQNMARYVDESRSVGAKPVLFTSLTRRQFKSDGKIHSSLIPYVESVKRVAAEKGVPLVDLHAVSIVYFEKLGPEGWYHLSTKKDDGKWDGTHLNAEGSREVAKLVVAELRTAVPELAPYLRK